MRLNSTKLLLVGAFALMASLSFAQVVEPTDSTKVEQDENVSLNETLIIGKGVIDVAENRKTPVASTVITREQILDKGVGNVEFPELLKNSPSIYIADQASGFGDAKLYMRGFDQSNTAFLLNGQPINGMDNGSLYWSNWQSVTDIANVIDAQRGLGASKLAISSVGGTVNIITKATDKKEGGFVRYFAGNDSYQKQTVGYNTGMKGKWGASFMFDNWSAHRSFARGTEGKGQSYFVSVGYKPNDHHTFNFMIFGAPQQHDQNFSKPMESKRDKNGVVTTPGYDITGRKGNSNYGFYNGEAMSARTNYYHKPVANLNWDWTINDKMSLSTVVYASTGTGGGVGVSGNGIGYTPGGGYTSNGEINWANVYANNATLKDGISDGYRNGTVLTSSVNNHFWYGAVSNFTYDTKKGLTFNAGTDIRFYTGEHYQQLNNLLGARARTDVRNANVNRPKGYEVTKTFSADPWNSLFNKANRSERVGFDNSERINYQGIFGQTEYANEKFSVFLQGALSWQEYEKYDNWNYTAERAEKEGIKFKNGKAYSGERTKIGYNLKAGASFNIDSENSIFANVGKYSRQPYLNNIFVRNTVKYVDDLPVNNEILQSIEAGYRYKSRTLRVNVNAYYTEWDNRSMTYNGQDFEDEKGVVHSNVRFIATNLSEVHKGLEADFEAKATHNWTITGYASYGDWKYSGGYNFQVQDTDTQELVAGYENSKGTLNAYVGNAAQFTFGMGTRLKVTRDLSFDTNFNYFARVFENVDLIDATKADIAGETYVNVPIRPYATVDLGMSYKFKITNNQALKFRGNINNLFNDQYISRKDNYGYFWGNGRTWNASVTYNF
ncbi:TonB-dependent receptor [Empedobacter brevis]|uniref:TonB-dependent receptor n=1 Tax=Empedobacter brevis TaxID=247 RepID=UPI002899B2AB|nr:TonB-dependent receptor plug domain-containing protein [Empedobacter brevis]